jgi:pyruvate,water dikinase
VIEVHARLQGFPAPAAARRVNKGDILVTISSSPSFTPLFVTAAAVVTEAGGILSHCAVVAREYRIPAVVGLEDARNRITDGQWIEVDEDAGVVRLIDPETVEKS